MYKKTIKIIRGLLIDCAIIICLSFLMWWYLKINVFYSTIILALYVLLVWLNRWKTPGIKLMTDSKEEQNNSVVSKRKIFLATFLDWFLIFSFMLTINLVLRQFVFIDTFVLFTFIAFLYYIVSYLTVKQTFGYYFCGIALFPKQGNTQWIVTIVKRELLKFGLGVWLPLGISYIIFKELLWLHVLSLFLLNIIVLLLYYVSKKEAWWNTIGKTQAQQKNSSLKSKHLLRSGFIAFIGLIFLVFLLYNNINNSSSEKLLGFNVPFKRIEYPNNHKVKPYIAFLKKHAQDPKEYLLSLFDKYDIVVLCEHLHNEDTQWDFIYDVVTDTRFVEKVGHIFTEYGCAKEQAKVDSFMRTSFPDSISLAQTTTTLLYYMGGNFYFFMQKLHQFNQTLPDSLYIQEHFTDIFSEKYLYAAYYDTLLSDRVLDSPLRDSLMAQVVIDWYEQNGGKCLVVTNYRHAFAVRNNVDSLKYPNQAQYIYNKYPKKTANVLIYGLRANNIYYAPVQHGLWNRAMKENRNIPVGFNFEGSPFGKCQFDMFPALNRNIFNCPYQDVFTGYIFYKPEEELTHSEPYHRRYAAEKEYEWAVQNNLIDSIQGKKIVNSYKDTGGKMKNTHPMVLYLNLYHFIDLLIWGLWAVIVFFITVGSLLRIVVRGNG